jgi:hypothetical protein
MVESLQRRRHGARLSPTTADQSKAARVGHQESLAIDCVVLRVQSQGECKAKNPATMTIGDANKRSKVLRSFARKNLVRHHGESAILCQVYAPARASIEGT